MKNLVIYTIYVGVNVNIKGVYLLLHMPTLTTHSLSVTP